MIHYTADTKYVKIMLEMSDGSVREVFRAINAIDIPGDSDPEQTMHRFELRGGAFIHLDSGHKHFDAGLFGQESEAQHINTSKER